MKIGLQVYSIKEEATENFASAMEKVKAMGYDGVELAGRYGLSAEEIKAVLNEVGLEAASAHVPIKEMEESPDETFAFYRTVGCPFVAVPWLAPMNDISIQRVRVVGMKAKEYGLHLLYHNHGFEFSKIGDEYALDRLYRTVEPEYLATELDTCWVKASGENPADYIRKYSGRTPVVHLKDFHTFEEKKEDGSLNMEFRSIGHGMQNIPAIIEAAKASGTEWLIVEQDKPSLGLTPMECADISRKYLRSIGL